MVCKFTPLCKSKFTMRSRGKKRPYVICYLHTFSEEFMIDFRQLHLGRQMPFHLSHKLNYWFAERKSVSRPNLRVCWTEIVKKSFNDQQWVKKLKNLKSNVCIYMQQTNFFTCDKGDPSYQHSCGSRP